MRRILVAAVLANVMVALVVAADRAAPVRSDAEAPPSAILMREMNRILANMKHTRYSHPTRVDEARGSYELDCSGLACYMLKRVLPEHYAKIAIPKGQARATAMNFHDSFAAASTDVKGRDGWRRIERILDARPGDILAWRANPPKPGATGHVVIIVGRPAVTPDRQVCVLIVDSTSMGHGNDTRAKGQTGIGRGLMWFTVDARGRPIGYRWSHPKGTLQRRAIAIGRPLPLR
jgi:hypothetical protein